MVCPEELLHFIWHYRLYSPYNLKTREGEALRIIRVGGYNRHAGPDFELATIQLGDTVWSGHVEIHTMEDDWTRHGHHLDPGYTATILHVVWEEGCLPNTRQDGTALPTLVLRHYVESETLNRYARLKAQHRGIPCEGRIAEILSTDWRPGWLERLTIERMEQKYERSLNWLRQTKQDWERVFLIHLGRAFGTAVNAPAFEDLMLDMDHRLLLRYRDDPDKIAALLFGIAGFLTDDCQDVYFVRLKQEYVLLARLHGLKNMPDTYWKFMRMRPYNFPTYRLGQLSALLASTVYWFERLCAVNQMEELFDQIRSVEINGYWATHFRFGKATKIHGTGWTDSFLRHLAINCFVPVLFSYGQFTGNRELTDRALGWLDGLPPEENHISRYYKQLGMPCKSAGDSQAMLVLKNNYCDQKQCLNCAIGVAIMQK